jgi:Tfp pilus assembly protein PilF
VKYLLICGLLIWPGVARVGRAGQLSQTAASPAAASQALAPAAQSTGQSDSGAKLAQPSSSGKQSTDPAGALDFLGSYSAPQAVLATETGHTSSRPPSVAADRRLADLGSDLGELPADPAAARRQVIQTISSGNHSPEEWFRAGTVALGAARADSRRLAESAPDSDWNHRFQSEALAARYPLIARSLWSGSTAARPLKSGAPAASAPSAEGSLVPSNSNADLKVGARSGNATPGATAAMMSSWRDELSHLDGAAETPETLYRRARLLVTISGAAYKLAEASPTLAARLFALQALAAEEENDEGAAFEEYRAGLAKYPESGLLHAGLGHLYRERNELEPARTELETADGLLPSDPLVAFDLGDVELRMGQPARALEMLNRALDLDSSLLVARWSRGRAYAALGGEENERRALEDLEATVSCDTSGALEWQLGQLYAKLGRDREARAAQQKSLDQRHAAEQLKGAAQVKNP